MANKVKKSRARKPRGLSVAQRLEMLGRSQIATQQTIAAMRDAAAAMSSRLAALEGQLATGLIEGQLATGLIYEMPDTPTSAPWWRRALQALHISPNAT